MEHMHAYASPMECLGMGTELGCTTVTWRPITINEQLQAGLEVVMSSEVVPIIFSHGARLPPEASRERSRNCGTPVPRSAKKRLRKAPRAM